MQMTRECKDVTLAHGFSIDESDQLPVSRADHRSRHIILIAGHDLARQHRSAVSSTLNKKMTRISLHCSAAIRYSAAQFRGDRLPERCDDACVFGTTHPCLCDNDAVSLFKMRIDLG
jgi:hypothetical protein